jgi:hypothetical protein
MAESKLVRMLRLRLDRQEKALSDTRLELAQAERLDAAIAAEKAADSPQVDLTRGAKGK